MGLASLILFYDSNNLKERLVVCAKTYLFSSKRSSLFSITSIASSKASIIHLLHSVRVGNLFVLIDLFPCDALVIGMLSIFFVGCFCNPLHHLQGYIKHHGNSLFPIFSLQQIGSTHLGLTRSMNLASYKCPKTSKNVLGLSN